MKNQCGDDLPLSYWASLVRADVKFYGRNRRPIAMVRAIVSTLATRNNIERCNVCGRRYVQWMAADDLYEEVHGTRGSQYCPACFDAKATKLGYRLTWVPHIWRDKDGTWNHNQHNEIGACQS